MPRATNFRCGTIRSWLPNLTGLCIAPYIGQFVQLLLLSKYQENIEVLLIQCKFNLFANFHENYK
jgi:hypothetical protein